MKNILLMVILALLINCSGCTKQPSYHRSEDTTVETSDSVEEIMQEDFEKCTSYFQINAKTFHLDCNDVIAKDENVIIVLAKHLNQSDRLYISPLHSVVGSLKISLLYENGDVCTVDYELIDLSKIYAVYNDNPNVKINTITIEQQVQKFSKRSGIVNVSQEDNAIVKSLSANVIKCRKSGVLTIYDDTGVVIDVISAKYGKKYTVSGSIKYVELIQQ